MSRLESIGLPIAMSSCRSGMGRPGGRSWTLARRSWFLLEAAAGKGATNAARRAFDEEADW